MDDSLGGVLHRAEVDLAAWQVGMTGVNLTLAPLETEGQVGSGADDADL